MKLLRPKPTDAIKIFTIDDVPVYGTLKVRSTSKDFLSVSKAFDFAKKQGGRLQTLGESLAIRVAFHNDDKETGAGLDYSIDYQSTSMISLKFKNDGSFNIDAPYLVAFTELDDSDESRKLVQEGYDANNLGKQLIKPIKDGFICDLIARAKDTGRIVPALIDNPLQLSTTQTKGKSEYGQHPNVIAVFGNAQLAELNAKYLNERNKKTGHLYDFISKQLEEMLKGKEDNTVVWAVALGGAYCDYVGDVVVNVNFVIDGRARSVVHIGAQNSTQS